MDYWLAEIVMQFALRLSLRAREGDIPHIAHAEYQSCWACAMRWARLRVATIARITRTAAP